MSDLAQPTTTSTAPPPTTTAPEHTSKPTPRLKAAPKVTAPAPAPTAASLLAPRYIPGAPPPEPPKEKKKRTNKKKGPKTAEQQEGSDGGVQVTDARSAALIDTAPQQSDVVDGRVAEELVATQEEIRKEVVEVEVREEEEEELEEDLPKWKVFVKSAAVETIGNKVKKLQAKLEHAQQKPSKPEGTLAKLGLEQKPLVETPAYMEGVIQELKDLKIVVMEEEEKRREKGEGILKEHRLADRKQHKQALKDAVKAAEAEGLDKINTILSFISLSSTLSSTSRSRPFTIPLDESERASIAKAAGLLLEEETRAEIVDGLLDENSTGNIDGIPFSRLRALAKSFSQPISSISSEGPDASGDDNEPSHVYANGTQSMQFMTASEVDAPAPLTFGGVGLEDVHGVGTEEEEAVSGLDASGVSVEGSSIPSAVVVQQEWVDVKGEEEVMQEEEPSAVPDIPAPIAPAPQPPATFDWAADDEDTELPSIDTLHAKFGTSGDVTPTSVVASATPPVQNAPASVNGSPVQKAPKAQGEEDWITPRHARNRTTSTATDGSTRGRGRGDFRGFRGGDRGSGFRGAPRGSGFRDGRGGGEGGGWRGGSNGSPNMSGGEGREERFDGVGRGRGRGGYRGPPRGGSEFRGERGGRGGFRGRDNFQQQQPQSAT